MLVASLADAGGQARLQLVAARGPSPDGTFAGFLRSGSTRQDGLVQSTDILPTLTSALGLATPEGAIGSPLTSVAPATSAAQRDRRLADLAGPAETIDPIVAPSSPSSSSSSSSSTSARSSSAPVAGHKGG